LIDDNICIYTENKQDYFQELLEKQQFIKNNIADSIAFLAIYIPIIKKEVVVFTELWNNYNIRIQKKQPYYIKGKPRINYFWPKGNNIKN
jgi:hypothetical protein